MNILPHKSWHVYNQKNRDRVKKDEAQAAVEEKQTHDRAIAAEREHRLKILRQRAHDRQSNSSGFGEKSESRVNDPLELEAPKDNDSKAPVQHINFWSDLEQQDTKSKRANPENEEEKKKKEDKWNRTVAMHLDTPVQGPAPWYTKSHGAAAHVPSKTMDRSEFTKIREDPMTRMTALLDERKQSHSSRKQRSPSPVRRSKGRERPKYHVESSRSSKDESRPESSSSKGMSTIERLRKERLEREQAEQSRARALLDPNYVNPRDRSVGEYSQQFNPRDTNHAHRKGSGSKDFSTARGDQSRPRHWDRHHGSKEGRSRPY